MALSPTVGNTNNVHQGSLDHNVHIFSNMYTSGRVANKSYMYEHKTPAVFVLLQVCLDAFMLRDAALCLYLLSFLFFCKTSL